MATELSGVVQAGRSNLYCHEPPAPAPVLDILWFPHVLDAVIAYADSSTCLALRDTSHEVRDLVDAFFCRHLQYISWRLDHDTLKAARPENRARWEGVNAYVFAFIHIDPTIKLPISGWHESALRHTRVLDQYALRPFNPIAGRVRHLRRFSIEFAPVVSADVLVDHIDLPPLFVFNLNPPVGSDGHAYAGVKTHVIQVEYAAGYGMLGLHQGTLTLPALAERIVFILRPAKGWVGGPAAESPEASFFGTLVRAALRHRSVTFVGLEDVNSAILGLTSRTAHADQGSDAGQIPFDDAVPILYRATERMAWTPGARLRQCSILTVGEYRAKVGREAFALQTERFWATKDERAPSKSKYELFAPHPSLYA